MSSVHDDELRMITATHLRRAQELCPRRLAKELSRRRDSARNWAANARFQVANRIEADARLAHTTMRSPEPGDFPTPTDLTVEQQHVYRAAATGYLLLFPDAACTAPDEELHPFATDLADEGVRLGAGVGVAVRRADSSPEVRVLSIGGRGFGRPILDDVLLHTVALRTDGWIGDELLAVVAADLLELRTDHVELELAVARPSARSFLRERLAVIDEIVGTPTARRGADCSGCGYIAGCEAHAQ